VQKFIKHVRYTFYEYEFYNFALLLIMVRNITKNMIQIDTEICEQNMYLWFRTIMLTFFKICVRIYAVNVAQAGFCKFGGPAVGLSAPQVNPPAFELKIPLNLFG
jgi:hypothetical protein